MTKRGGSDLTNSSHRPIAVRKRDDNIPQPATLAHLNLTALSRQVLQRWDAVTVCVIPLIPNRADDAEPLDRPIGVTKCCGPSRCARLGMTCSRKEWGSGK